MDEEEKQKPVTTDARFAELAAYFQDMERKAKHFDALIDALDRLMVVGSAATGHLMCDFGAMHKYIEEVMGRPVFTHEMGTESVAAEIREKAKQPFVEAIEQAQAVLTKARKLEAEGKECHHLRRRSDLMAPPTVTCIDCGADLNEGERRELSRLYQKDKAAEEDTS